MRLVAPRPEQRGGVRLAVIKAICMQDFSALVGLDLIVDGEVEQDALHRGCQDKDAPRAPASPAKPGEEARSKDEAAGGLHAHHGDAEAADMLQVICSPDLGEILHPGKHGGHDAEDIRPGAELVLGDGRQDARHNDDGEAVEKCQGGNQQGGLPSRLAWAQFFFVLGKVVGVVSEEYEEEDEAAGFIG